MLSNGHDASLLGRVGEFSHMDMSCAVLLALRELALTHFMS